MKNNYLPIDITTSLELDPLSDRYRVCPNCSKPHMVRNKGRDFCSDRCADQHYNTRRRLMKQVQQTVDPEVALALEPNKEFAPEQRAEIGQAPELAKEIFTRQNVPPVESNASYDRNIEILNSLPVDPENGTVLHVADLTSRGFVFDYYSGRGVLHNIDPTLNCHFMQYGLYRIYRIDFSIILIYKFHTTKTEKS